MNLGKVSKEKCCICNGVLFEVTYPEVNETFIGVGPVVFLENGRIGYTCENCFNKGVEQDINEHMKHIFETDN